MDYSSANYNKAGQRLQTETTIKNDELPEAALDYICNNFASYKLVEAAPSENNRRPAIKPNSFTIPDIETLK